MRPLSFSSVLICAIVAFSGTVTFTVKFSRVSASISSAQRHTPTASSTLAASTQQTYAKTRTPAGSRCFSPPVVPRPTAPRRPLDRHTRRAAAARSRLAAFGSVRAGASPSAATSAGPSPVASSASAASASCTGSSAGLPIIASTRAISSRAPRSSSSNERSSNCSSECSFFSGSAILFLRLPRYPRMTIPSATSAAVCSPRSAVSSFRPNANDAPGACPVMSLPSCCACTGVYSVPGICVSQPG